MIIEKINKNTEDIICKTLVNGDVVILPCDTVYSLSSIYLKGENKLKEVKGRDANKPFLILATIEQVKKLCTEIPDSILKTWPAPLTVILKQCTGNTLAVRVPDDPFILNLLNNLQSPIYSTSVNMSGEPFISSFNEIVSKFENKVSLIVKGKEVTDSIPSTLIDATCKPFKVIRQGSFNAETIIKESI